MFDLLRSKIMRALFKLFGQSPFATFIIHMEKVADCVRLLPRLFEAMERADYEKMAEIAATISKLEHKADLTKNDIRSGLKSHLFLPVARVSLLELLAIQDNIADKAEDIAVLTQIKPLSIPEKLEPLFNEFLTQNCRCFEGIFEVMMEMRELLESSFGGAEADKIRKAIDEVAYAEHQIDLTQRKMMKVLYNMEDELSYSTFHLWDKLMYEIGMLSNLSEKLGNRLLATMELK